jgi:SAM-dependent methyltransferase
MSDWQTFWDDKKNHEWWKRPAPIVLELIQAQSPSERPRVLDLGCGLGRHAIAFAQAGFQVTATDASANAVAHLDGWARRLGLCVETKVCGAVDDGFAPQSFDIVVSFNVIYHGYRGQFAAAIDHVRDLLKPGGLFFFTCPSREDGKYGRGPELAPHTFSCETSIVPGDIHYFSSDADLDEMLRGFTILSRMRDEHTWTKDGEGQFSSYWQVLAEKQ